MSDFFDRLLVRAATIDELLSDEFEALPGQKSDSDTAARCLAAWCRSCASGDWELFARRLRRDRLSIDRVLARFATVRRRAGASTPSWLEDARWIDATLRKPIGATGTGRMHDEAERRPFGHLFVPVIEAAEKQVWRDAGERAHANLTPAARACLRGMLLEQVSDLCAPALYDRFIAADRSSDTLPEWLGRQGGAGATRYDDFVAEMRGGGFRRLFEEKPVLLRLIAAVTRQWIDATREFVTRLDGNLSAIRGSLLGSVAPGRVAKIEGGLSDPHNGGRSVHIVTFEDGGRVVYKPKDIRIDAQWYALIDRLNRSNPPVDLKAALVLSREGYGWTEFIDHTECESSLGFERYFRRAGAWLALFHAFAASDMHHENIIAAGDHPVPIDLEAMLQADHRAETTIEPATQAFMLAREKTIDSVATVGLLPAYSTFRSNEVFGFGGLDGGPDSVPARSWSNVNTDDMRPSQSREPRKNVPNLPHTGGGYARLGDHVEDVIAGFQAYAKFLSRRRNDPGLFDGFAGLPVRKVVRPTSFYSALLRRLKNPRAMDDGAVWSAQIDFMARLADWDRDTDPMWGLQGAERNALVELNVPHFVSPSDRNEISDATGIRIHTFGRSGIDRARTRVERLDEREIAWQVEIIRQSTSAVSGFARRTAAGSDARRLLRSDEVDAPSREFFVAQAGKIVGELAELAIRSGSGAAWIGLDWLGDTDVCQLLPLGPDLYNGTCGIAIFLAAYARLASHSGAETLALAGISDLRQSLRGGNAARMARISGIGGATGLGSIVYSLSVLSEFLDNDELLTDAHAAAMLLSDDLVAADSAFDVMGGSAGAILGLLRLHLATGAGDVLERAITCGEHLLEQGRIGPEGRWGWRRQGAGSRLLNGMSHGAAGIAYSLGSLSAVTGREDFAVAAGEYLAFENASYDPAHANWPDNRDGAGASWPCQWCHGAVGIGLARIGTIRLGLPGAEALLADVRNALRGAELAWPQPTDTLCCGTLGAIELLSEAGSALGRAELGDRASLQLKMIVESAASNGDFRWLAGDRRYNLGLFRGLAGVGYTLLRRVDASLPNVSIWE